ncbi:MAG: hypothetical protein ABSD57_05010 [Verrucomicrobiota bacterium]|jgi:hypothetical protein
MKMRSIILSVAAAGCAMGLVLPPRAAAVVSDEDFNALKSQVQQLNDQVQELKREHQQDGITHNEDQMKIQQLQQQLGETQVLATNAAQKAEAAAKIQPVYPVPSGAMSALHNFTMVGDAEVQFGKTEGSHSGFMLADFAPIFLYRAGDNILFEAGFDVTLQNSAVPLSDGSTGNGDAGTSVSLSFAQLDYLYNDYVTLVAGYMVLPLGTYSERAAGWLNKIPDDPLAVDFLPGAGAGAQLRGSIPVGDSGQMVTYSVYGANGPSSVDGTGKATTTDASGNTIPNISLNGNIGVNADGSSGSLNGDPSGGGRIGWFYPWKPHYDVELGISGQAGPWDNAGQYLWSAAVLDAALHISPYFEAKGEYINTWQETSDAGTLRARGWWAQVAYKLAGLNLDYPVVNDLELVGRYDGVNDGVGTKTDRYTMGYVYYLTSTLLFEGDYEFLHSRGPNALPSNQFILQLSYGF